MANTFEKCSVEVLLSGEAIQRRISDIAAEISKDFKDKDALIIAVLKGSFVFCADLIRKLNLNIAVDFISLSSYSGTSPDGRVNVIAGLKETPEGRDVIIVEDIVDTGHTLDFLLKELSLKKPKSISTCVLLDKKCARVKQVPVEYVCFEVGSEFVVGYGLDYNGFYRGLPYIGILKDND
ncbi:MAG: hypoxanthine phosphoribosyltransferase [Endomicrobia bacterium]|nr:hypoxanthine phosphoribosyltransferase [Endomicrobiia bacterium]